MTKNTIGGKGHKRAKKQNVDFKNVPLKDNENMDYGIITNVLGNGRMKVVCLNDKKERLGHIRGTLYKKIWIAKDDVVLVSLRDFQNEKCDIIFKYTSDEIKILIKKGEIERDFNKNDKEIEDDDELIFVEEDIDEKSEIDIDEI